VLNEYLDSVAEAGSISDIAWATYIYFLCYYPLFAQWQGLDSCINRFGADGISGMAVLCINIFAISGANMSLKGIREDVQTALFNFSLSMVIMQIALLLMNLRVFFSHLDNAKYFVANLATTHGFFALGYGVLSLLAYLPSIGPEYFYGLWTVLVILQVYIIRIALVIGPYLVSPLLPSHLPRISVPLHVSLTAERSGLFIVLAIGECAMATVGAVTDFTVRNTIGLLVAVIHGYGFKIGYFDTLDCPGEHATKHALKVSINVGGNFFRLHFPLSMGITMSAGLILTVFKSHLTDELEPIGRPQQILYALALSAALVSMWELHGLHERDHPHAHWGMISEGMVVYFAAAVMVLVGVSGVIADPLVLQIVYVSLFYLGIFFGCAADAPSSSFPHGHSIASSQVEEEMHTLLPVDALPAPASQGYGSTSGDQH
jgi:low temperature requirement protein LtrA